jgi:ATP-dependent DNA ligase
MEKQFIKTFPVLYKKTSTGAIQMWQIGAVDVDGIATIVTKFGQVGGKIQESIEQVLEGKNIGKSNATTALEQAEAQAKSRWEKQLKKGYVKTIEDAQAGKVDDIIEGGIVPMLAHKFSEQGHKIKFPALAQPKLDGHRCVEQTESDDITIFCSLWNRTRKPIKSAPHISEAIREVFRKNNIELLHFDGELYNHDYHNNFEDLSSLIRQEEPQDGCEAIQYHVYDIPHPTMTNSERNALLQSLKPFFEGTPIHIVETIIVNNEDELMEAFDHFIAQGYEGCMVRNIDGLYVNKRSYDLQKVKDFQDDEFVVIGVKVGTKGSMAGKAVFTFELPNGESFDAKMKGKLDDLIQYAEHPELIIGKMVTVKYQGFTKYGKPRFPVAIRIRHEE